MTNFDRHYLAGHIDKKIKPFFILIRWRDGSLYIQGVLAPEPPKIIGGAMEELVAEECGQCLEVLRRPEFRPVEGSSPKKLLKIWEEWHLNDMRPECEHQRRDWDLKASIGEDLPGFVNKRGTDAYPLAVWVTDWAHPKGLLGKPCVTCGHPLGLEWTHEEVPAHVIRYLRALPDHTRRLPKAWRIAAEEPKVWAVTDAGGIAYTSTDDLSGQVACERYVHDTLSKSVVGASKDGVLVERVAV